MSKETIKNKFKNGMIPDENDFGELIDYAGESDAEVIQARGDAPLLKDRLDKTDAQLAEKATKEEVEFNSFRNVLSNDFIKYGEIDIHEDFPEFPYSLPFDLYRDLDGVIKHTFDINKEVTDITNDLYVASSGHDTNNDGLTPVTPFRTIRRAVEVATVNGWGKLAINLIDKIVDQDSTLSLDFSVFTKVVVRPHVNKKVYFSKSHKNYTFSSDGRSYKTTVSAVMEVLDINNPDYRGIPKPLSKVASKAICDSTPNSFYVEGSFLWINTCDSRHPNLEEDIMIIRNLPGTDIILGSCTLILKDLLFVSKGTGAANNRDALRVEGLRNSKLINYNVSTTHGNFNGIATVKVDEVYSFDTTTTLAGMDGFNYHGEPSTVPDAYGFVFEYNCHSYNQGLLQTNTNNATSAHDRMAIIRVGSVGCNTHGPVLADVNSCDSLNYDCTMYDAKGGSANTKSAYYFDESVTSAIKRAKAVLINCGGGGKDTLSINSDRKVDISVKKFKGNNVPNDIIWNVIE